MLLQGIFPAVTTPFYPDGAVYYKKIEHNIDRYSRTPIAGMVVLGSTGEAVMLSDEERREVLRVTAEVAAPEKVLIAGTGAESAIETLRLTEQAARMNYDVALVRTPHFYRPQMKPEAMLAFFRTVADRSPLPVLLYTVPPFTAYDLPLEVITALAEHPNIIGIKESSGNVEKVAAMVNATKHIQRTATVSEVQQAVTARMLASPAKDENGGQHYRRRRPHLRPSRPADQPHLLLEILRRALGEPRQDAQSAGVGNRGSELGEPDVVHATLDDRVLDAK